MTEVQGYCESLQPNPDISGLGAFLAVSIQVGMVIVAGLVFSVLQFGESKRSNPSANSVADEQNGTNKPKGPRRSGLNTTRNQLSALSRLLFVVFDTQPIISVAIYVAFVINAPGLLDGTGGLSNYHLRVSVHLQALSGIQLVAPLVLVFGTTRRRLLRFIWFEIHLVFFIGLSSIQILLQKDAAQTILPLEREAQCSDKGDWASRDTSYATGVVTLTAYLFLVCVAVAHMLLTTRSRYQEVPRTDEAITQAKSRARVRLIAEMVIFAYLIAFAGSQIFIVQSLRKEYRKIWGDEENTWGFGQVLALVTLIPAIIDYLEAIVLGIDQSLSAAVMRHGPQEKDQMAAIYVNELLNRILRPWKSLKYM